jgi:predicted glycosyltransferase
MLRLALADDDVEVVLLPRTAAQRARYEAMEAVRVPKHAIDGSSLLALADLVVGAGGTMNREAAILGTPTYTVFAGKLAAVDAALIRLGRMHDLREAGTRPRFEKKGEAIPPRTGAEAERVLDVVVSAIGTAAPGSR